jgi:catechol 2,3-dioxygenase-like lactoylglutathione lyase family enzyme
VAAFVRVGLQTSASRIDRLGRFYAEHLGLGRLGEYGFPVGETELVFQVGAGELFYHVALLVPGDRFDAAVRWARTRVDPLPGGGRADGIFDFDAWEARACYFLDPAGNIVELIAHRGLGENGEAGTFDPAELVGVSEVGLVGDPHAIATGLEQLDLRLWDGEPGPRSLAFVGERGRTLIVAPEGHGWLPTRRPAQPFPVDVLMTGPPQGEVTVGAHRIRRVRAPGDADL